MGALRFETLGSLAVLRDGEQVPLGGQRPRAVLAVLLADAGRVLSVDTVVDRVWGETAPRTANKNVQKYVAQLRRELGPERIVHRSGYAVVTREGELDLATFETLVRAAEDGTDAAGRLELLDRALGLWRGEPFADLPDVAALDALRSRFGELRLTAVEARNDALLALGRAAEVVHDTESLTAEHPLRERLWAQRVRALARTGRQAEALEAHRVVRERLADELGIDPSPELRELERSVLLQQEVAAREEHRPVPLPVRVLPVFGTEALVGHVVALLGSERLVTLVGPGGSGKTTHALEVARRLLDGDTGAAWLVELASVAPGGDAAPTVAHALGSDGPVPPAEVIAGQLAVRPGLLVLDNAEHVLDSVASLAVEVLHRAPGTAMLVTSRSPLGVRGETVVRVEPLTTPPVDAPPDLLLANDAVRLLLDRARRVAPAARFGSAELTVLARVARRLGGLPLALELAAAQLRVVSPEELDAQLRDEVGGLANPMRDAPSRHRSITAAIEWSRGLLDDELERVFEELSVFRGGFTAEGLAAVTRPERDAVGVVGDLVDRSLVAVADRDDLVTHPDVLGTVPRRTRYALLEPVRAVAAQHLGGRVEDVLDRHTAWALDTATRAGALLRGPRELEGVALMEGDDRNIHLAAQRALHRRDVDTLLGIGAAVRDYGQTRLQPYAYAVLAAEAVALAQARDHPLGAVTAGGLARVRLHLGDVDGAAALADRTLASLPDDDERRFGAHVAAAGTADVRGRPEEGLAHARAAQVLAARTGEPYDEAAALELVVLTSLHAGDTRAATAALDTLAAVAARTGNPTRAASHLWVAAEVRSAAGDVEEAFRLLDRSIDVAASVGSAHVLGVARWARLGLEVAHRAPHAALPSVAWHLRHWSRRGDGHLRRAALVLAELLDRLGDDDRARQLRRTVDEVAWGTPRPSSSTGGHARTTDEPAVLALDAPSRREDVVDLGLAAIAHHVEPVPTA